jgi:hypothetical protein
MMPSDIVTVLLETISESNRMLSVKFDAVVERMATRDDIAQLRSDLRGTVGVREYEVTIEAIQARVAALEIQVHDMSATKVPTWVWQVVAGMAGAGLSTVTALIGQGKLLHH